MVDDLEPLLLPVDAARGSAGTSGRAARRRGRRSSPPGCRRARLRQRPTRPPCRHHVRRVRASRRMRCASDLVDAARRAARSRGASFGSASFAGRAGRSACGASPASAVAAAASRSAARLRGAVGGRLGGFVEPDSGGIVPASARLLARDRRASAPAARLRRASSAAGRDSPAVRRPASSPERSSGGVIYLCRSSMILFCSASKPSISASGRGGQPGT